MLKKHSRKFQVNQKYRHTTKRNKKNKLNASAIHPLSVGVACCPQTQRGEEMEEKVNEKVIIISAKDLIKEKCIISYIESLTAEDMVSLVIEDPDRRLKGISKETRFGRTILKRRWRGLLTVTGWSLVRCIWQNISMTWTQTNCGYIFRQLLTGRRCFFRMQEKA